MDGVGDDGLEKELSVANSLDRLGDDGSRGVVEGDEGEGEEEEGLGRNESMVVRLCCVLVDIG